MNNMVNQFKDEAINYKTNEEYQQNAFQASSFNSLGPSRVAYNSNTSINLTTSIGESNMIDPLNRNITDLNY